MQNLGVAGGESAGGIVGAGGPPHNTLNMDTDLIRTRAYMREKIIDILKFRHQNPITDASMIKFWDFARRLEEGLFKNAHTKEDYSNLSTLEYRLQTLIKGRRNMHNQRHQQLVNSELAPVGTMIPTPGISQSGNPSIMASSSIDTSMSAVNSSIAPTNVNTGSLLPTGGMTSGSFSISEVNMSNGYLQSPANFPIASGGISSIGVQRMTSQMIPTPGFNSNNNNSSINNTLNMDTDLIRMRTYMQEKIIDVLKFRHQNPITNAPMIKFRDFARRLEEGLFKNAHTKEDYSNLSTLEYRLQTLIKGRRNMQNQRHPQLVNSASAPVGTMIPTPGMSQSIMASSSGVEHHDGVLHQQASEQFQLPELQNQFQQNHAEELAI